MKCINPKCGRIKTVQEIGDHEYLCNHCGWRFDDDPDEGGDHTNNPEGRSNRKERNRPNRIGGNF